MNLNDVKKFKNKFLKNNKNTALRNALIKNDLNTVAKYAKKNAFVMHPGPMNRGVEIDSRLADDITRSLIQEQVAMGVAIRMACLDILIKNRDNVLSY